MQEVLARYARCLSGIVLHPLPPPPHVAFGGSVWVRARTASQQRDSLLLVPKRFRADSGTNLFKQREIVTGRSSGSSARMV